jgi:hypothetical protein
MKALAVLILMASPTMADDLVTFQSPTGNIHCNIY